MKKDETGITVTQIGIGEILRRFRLRVPPNQRDYSWTDLEVTTLFKDLARAIADNESEYFLGTISTIPDEHGGLEVIDGQQRLATTTILLSQIRRYLIDKDPTIAADIQNFLTYIDRGQRSPLNNLTLNLIDNEFFRTMLSDDGPPPPPTRRSHRLLSSAFIEAQKYVTTIVASYEAKDHGDMLNKWVDFIEWNATVILLKAPSGANLYKMFETLNDRGLRTTQADLVKNYLFGQAGNQRFNEAQGSWSLMRGMLEPLQEEDDKEDITVTFLRHALIAIQGFLRKDKVYEVVQKEGKGSQASVALLKKCDNLAGVYVATFFQDHEKWRPYPDAMRRAIQTVNFFHIQPFRPILLSIAAKFPPKEALKAFQLFISLGVRLIIASSTRSGNIEETLADAANLVFTGKIATVKELENKIEGIIPTDEPFKTAFEDMTVSKGPFARYYLRTLESVARGTPDPWYTVNEDKEEIDLEHVLPEHPGDNYPEFTEEEVKTHFKRIGNMVLMRKKDNSDLRSANFSEKAKVFKDSPYVLTSQVASVATWSVKRIIERQKVLAGLALKAWPI